MTLCWNMFKYVEIFARATKFCEIQSNFHESSEASESIHSFHSLILSSSNPRTECCGQKPTSLRCVARNSSRDMPKALAVPLVFLPKLLMNSSSSQKFDELMNLFIKNWWTSAPFWNIPALRAKGLHIRELNTRARSALVIKGDRIECFCLMGWRWWIVLIRESSSRKH